MGDSDTFAKARQDVWGDLDVYGLPRVDVGDRIEFAGFGAPDQYWDPASEQYKPIPNQLLPGTRGTVTGFGLGQLWVDWDSGHGVALVVGAGATVSRDSFSPDRFRLAPEQVGTIGPRSRTSPLAERASVERAVTASA